MSKEDVTQPVVVIGLNEEDKYVIRMYGAETEHSSADILMLMGWAACNTIIAGSDRTEIDALQRMAVQLFTEGMLKGMDMYLAGDVHYSNKGQAE